MGCTIFRPSIVVHDHQFSLLREIASGGFSTVYEIYSTDERRTFALKKADYFSREDEAKFVEEMKRYRQFQHPNIIRLLWFDVNKNSKPCSVLMVFPYYSNGTLQDKLSSTSSISVRERFIIIRGITSALQEIHGQDLAHRDIKAANIMLTDKSEPVLCDFGSMTLSTIHVKDIKEAQRLQDWIDENCSLLYRPPEMIRVEIGKDITSKADMWSLACIWYNLLFLEGPFDTVYRKGDSVPLAVLSFRLDKRVQDILNEDDYSVLESLFALDPKQRLSADCLLRYITSSTHGVTS